MLSPSPRSAAREDGAEFSAGKSQLKIWLVEDSATDVFVIREVLRLCGFDFELLVLPDGEAALLEIHALAQRERRELPGVILLDLNLPKVTGLEVLAGIRKDELLSGVPVVVVTSSDSMSDLKAIRELGATAYFRKPHDLDEFMRLSDVVKQAIGPRS